MKLGRPDDYPRRALLQTLHVIYRESGGKKRGIGWSEHSGKLVGRFLDLVLTLCCQADIRTAGIDELALKAANKATR